MNQPTNPRSTHNLPLPRGEGRGEGNTKPTLKTTTLALLLTACTTTLTTAEEPLSIEFDAINGPVTPRVEDQTLILGDTRVHPWPREAPACQGCNLGIELRHHPVGPDITLTLHQGEQLRWRLVHSVQPAARLSDGIVIRHQGETARLTVGGQALDLEPGQTAEQGTCTHTLHNLETLPQPDQEGIANESPKTRLQLLTTCPRNAP